MPPKLLMQQPEEDEEGKMNYWKALIEGAFACSKRCAAKILRSSPIEPCEEVSNLIKSLGMNDGHLLTMSHVFIRVKQSESDEIIQTAYSVPFESLQQLIQRRRRWVARMMRCLLRLGGCEPEEDVEWDDFLWISLRFCSLTKEELCQALFIIVCQEVQSPQYHYLTREQLETFFAFYEDCPVDSFDTMYIDFNQLPLSRYYIADFCELVTRFRQLLNPIIHLQQCLQSHMPGQDFWVHHGGSELFTRKISLEYFTMKRVRVNLRGDPPFRDSCDFLAPDALGCESLNQDQWYLRARGIPQTSVWGGQPTPEMAEARQRARERAKAAEKAAEEAEQKRRQELLRQGILLNEPEEEKGKGKGKGKGKTAGKDGEKGTGKGKDAAGTAAAAPNPYGDTPAAGTTAAGTQNAAAKAAPGGPAATQLGKPQQGTGPTKTTAGHLAANMPGVPGQLAPGIDPSKNPIELSIKAACVDEVLRPPGGDLPPPWMRVGGAVVAPAPQARQPNPPFWRRDQLGQSYYDEDEEEIQAGFNMLVLDAEEGDEEGTALLSPSGMNTQNSGFGR